MILLQVSSVHSLGFWPRTGKCTVVFKITPGTEYRPRYQQKNNSVLSFNEYISQRMIKSLDRKHCKWSKVITGSQKLLNAVFTCLS